LLSIFSLIKWKMRLGVDFTGGAVINYSFSKVTDSALISDTFKKVGIEDTSISSSDQKHFTIKTDALTVDTKNKIDEELKNVDSEIQELRYEVVGPAIGPELIQKTVYALLISASLILFWVAYQFKNLKYGLAATLATIHDSLVLLGSFSLLGHFLGVEIDFIFVTAVLTILSFSVHDTIVVFDRIREVKKKTYGDISEISDTAITQTMTRSINNSFTIIFMLVALVLLGGETTKWFAVALLIGTISGTYSSPFVAVPLLVIFDKGNLRFKLKKN